MLAPAEAGRRQKLKTKKTKKQACSDYCGDYCVRCGCEAQEDENSYSYGTCGVREHALCRVCWEGDPNCQVCARDLAGLVLGAIER